MEYLTYTPGGGGGRRREFALDHQYEEENKWWVTLTNGKSKNAYIQIALELQLY